MSQDKTTGVSLNLPSTDGMSARLPPAGITGLDPAWSRLVEAPDSQGVARTWHLLDTWAGRTDTTIEPALTLLCVHGNPSWSFLWRHVLACVPSTVRAIAVDQLDMGFSERSGVKRTLGMRVDDLCELTQVLELTGPVVTLAHDWGGPISMGWALRHLPQLKGVVLTNTAVHQPAYASPPAVIRLIRIKALRKLVTVRTTAFIRGAIEMSKPALSKEVCAGFHAPYLTASRRAAIDHFVSGIPLDASHESAKVLDDIAAGMASLASTPALLLWGPRDKVFSDVYLHDLEQRLPHASVHRYPLAAHFVSEDADVAGAVRDWLGMLLPTPTASSDASLVRRPSQPRITSARALADFSMAAQTAEAVVELTPRDASITFADLGKKVELLAAGMAAFGIEKGDRVAVLVTPGIDLVLAVYGCWRLGATLVLVDSGLGKTGMQRALRSANSAYLIGIDKALVAAKLLGWPGEPIAVASRSAVTMRSLGVVTDMVALCKLGEGKSAPDWPSSETPAAVVFTSGSTGPSKGVVYLHKQIQAQRDALMNVYNITPDDRLVAAFAPFALYGPTMGITSMVPVMDVTKPGTLSAKALSAAVSRINATMVFASPAALVNIVATQQTLSTEAKAVNAAVRLVLSAGAPVRASLLASVRGLFSYASLHTPYGMTEVLPLADISLNQLEGLALQRHNADLVSAVDSAGVCVGYPLEGVQIFIDPLGEDGEPTGVLTQAPDVLGEIIVQAEHIREGYDKLWHTNYLASMPEGVHRSGDVGQLDEAGRLYVAGRLGHVIKTAKGPFGPVSGEQLLEAIPEVALAALVGVGPAGTQAVVAVLQMSDTKHKPGGAPLELVDQVRKRVGSLADIAAVLVAKRLPVDRRHNSKIDRTAVAQWATNMLAGDKETAL